MAATPRTIAPPAEAGAPAPATTAGERDAWRFAPWIESFVLRHRGAFIAGVVLFYLFSFNGLWRIGPDSALYLSIGRSIARGEGYVYQGESHRLVYPGLPYLLAGAMRVSEKHAIAVADAAMLLIGLASIYLSWELFRRITRPGAALVATVLLAANVTLYEMCFEILTDLPFLLGTMMVLLGGVMSGALPAPRLDPQAHATTAVGRWVGAGMIPLGLALCAVMRPTFYALGACAVVAGLIAVIAQRRWRSVLMLMVVAAAAVGVYLLVDGWAQGNDKQISRDLYEQSAAYLVRDAIRRPQVAWSNARDLITPELPTAFYGYSWGCYGNVAASAVLLGVLVWTLWRWPMALLWVGATIAVQLVVGPVPRYMLPVLPILVLAWWEAASRGNAMAVSRRGNLIALIMYLALVPGFCRCVGDIWSEQYRRPFAQHYREGTFAAIWEAGRLIRETTPPDAVVIAPVKTDRALTFLSDRWVIPAAGRVPQRMRSHPVYALVHQQDLASRVEARARGIHIRERVGQTDSRYRKGDVLVLKKAQWK